MKFILLLIISTHIVFIQCSHFFGGSVSAKFMVDTGTQLVLQFQTRMGWRRDYTTRCTDSLITAGNIFLGSGLISCRSSCSGDLGNVRAYCIAYNIADNWAYGEIIYNRTVNKNIRYVEASFASGAWIRLENPGSGGGRWEVRTRLDTVYRNDINSYNTCPTTIMPPVIKLRKNIRQDFAIPFSDENNDDVRCRQALAAKGECADVCVPLTAVTLNVSACHLYFDASLANIGTAKGWYAIALMIEDFTSTASNTPMCGVPLQFMIQVQVSASTCMTPPKIIGDWPDGSCIAANMSQQLNLRMVAEVGCASNSIYTIQILGPSVTFGSPLLTMGGSPAQWSSNLTWTPKPSQYGPNLICGLATDNSYLISNLNCYTILAGITVPYIIRGTGYPAGVLTPVQQAGNNGFITWSIKFNLNPILKPVKRTYVRLFYANGTQVFKMDCSIFPSITYVNDTMFIETGNNFAAGSYYWTFGYGVGCGPEYCRPETYAIFDPTFWTFTWIGPSTTILSTQTFPPGGTVGTSGASPTSVPILPLGVTTASTTTTTPTTAFTGSTTTGVLTTTIAAATTGASSTVLLNTTASANSSTTNTVAVAATTSTLAVNTSCISPFPTSTNCTIESMSIIYTTMLSASLTAHVGGLVSAMMVISKKRMLLF